MVHQTIATKMISANSASIKINTMNFRLLRLIAMSLIVGTLAACSTKPPQTPATPPDTPTTPVYVPVPGTLSQSKSRWVPVEWNDLPGFSEDALFEAWNAWLRSCEKPAPAFAPLCGDVRRLSIASGEEQRAWMMDKLRPYRVEGNDGKVDGMLTGYYEPFLDGSRTPGNGFNVPLYGPPADLGVRKPWYTRQQIDTLPAAQAALAGKVVAWVRDPVEAMVLHIQGSGRVKFQEADGSTKAWCAMLPGPASPHGRCRTRSA